MTAATVVERVPQATLDWLCDEEYPAVAVLTRRHLLGEGASPDLEALWARRNEYSPVAAILDAVHEDGAWLEPERDYKKYEGSLWQIHFLGELHADGDDERARRGADYAFSRQIDDGSWSSNGRASASAPCLTANVGRALARLGYAQDERITHAIRYIADLFRSQGFIGCRDMRDYTLNGYCHMLAPKVLLFLAEVPEDRWPRGARKLRDACVAALRSKEIVRCLPVDFKAFQEAVWQVPKAQMVEAREAFIAKHEPLEYKDKPGWLRFGYPLSYNSDALESLAALAAVGEGRRPEYEHALAAVETAADAEMRWTLKTTFNGKMRADVEVKGEPSRWLTLRALRVLDAFG